MRVRVNYGKGFKEIEADSVVIASPNSVEERNQTTVLRESLDYPVNSNPLSFFTDDKFLLVVNDAQRPTPTPAVLDSLLERIPHDEFEVEVATGSHPPPTEEELVYIFGRHLSDLRDRIHIHKALDHPHTYYGTTSQGTEVYFDEILTRFDNVVTITSVEPHYFAGFTGGRKSFLPGLASYRTIEQNHAFAMKKEARNLALKGNPVHEGMEEAVNLLKNNIFSINTVLDKNRRIYACSSGNIFGSFYQAAQWAENVYCVPTGKYNIVLAAASYPLDGNLYQAQKAIENGKLALNDEGILILVAQCRDGIGPDKFYNLLKESETPGETLDVLTREYKLGYHKAGKIAELATRAHIWAVTDLEDDIIRNAFMTPYHSVQEAVDDAVRQVGGEILFLPEASTTVPLCRETCQISHQ
ncbi:MAG: nickel-dependent lactate racemase [Theionarchaea archaeon]|nr:nickel-dependent lactate racemase [Theionarchaea archaeon]MBU7020342.1 nickel-dependent lactate racemase [Theionarchaea archaeon]MBU7034811.1 nickel-dependent lactate racemase [Theionarchaea archaeon]MBU7040276.1 nickel-dependent lactate racemase [Theionarchaea archaeon]